MTSSRAMVNSQISTLGDLKGQTLSTSIIKAAEKNPTQTYYNGKP